MSVSTAIVLRIQVFWDDTALLGECFYSNGVKDSGVLGCDAALLGECFYSNSVKDSGVLGCDAALLDKCFQTFIRNCAFSMLGNTNPHTV